MLDTYSKQYKTWVKLCKSFHISLDDSIVVMYLAEKDGPVTAAQLSRILCMSRAKVSRILARLSERMWAEEAICPSDLRIINLQLARLGNSFAMKVFGDEELLHIARYFRELQIALYHTNILFSTSVTFNRLAILAFAGTVMGDSVQEAACACGVCHSTASEATNYLEKQFLISVTKHPSDFRKNRIRVTDRGAEFLATLAADCTMRA